MSIDNPRLLAVAKEAFAKIAAIDGWLSFDALYASAALIAAQAQVLPGGERVALAEIGVHHGKYFVGFSALYGALRTAAVSALAVDLFESQELNIDGSGRGEKAIFTGHVRRTLVPPPQLEVLQADSMTLDAARLSHGGQLDFASIDGGHHYKCVRSDMQMVSQATREGGIVSLDDFFHPGWVEVSAAFFYSSDATLRPLLVAGGKLFLVKDSTANANLHAAYLSSLIARFAVGDTHAVNTLRIGSHLVETKLQPFLERRILYLTTYDQRPLVRILRRALRRMQIQ